MYVIQMRERAWSNKWITLNERYETLAKASDALNAKSSLLKPMLRIAEEYTVTRYKTVKIQETQQQSYTSKRGRAKTGKVL